MFDRAEIYDINQVSEVAAVSVFPAVKLDKKNGNHNEEEHRKQYLDKDFASNKNSKYLVIPNRNQWKNMGWKKNKYQRFLNTNK